MHFFPSLFCSVLLPLVACLVVSCDGQKPEASGPVVSNAAPHPPAPPLPVPPPLPFPAPSSPPAPQSVQATVPPPEPTASTGTSQPVPAPATTPSTPQVSESGEVPGESAGVIAKKLDSQLSLAVKQLRGELPTAGPGAVVPNIPIKDPDGSRVLVDVSATVSQDLFDHLKSIGATVGTSSVVRKTVRAMVPVDKLESVAARPDVTGITPAILTDSNVIKPGRSN